MTFHPARVLSHLCLISALCAAAASAQTLDGTVVRNPDSTVTYAIDLDGPPLGTAFVLVSPVLAPMPIPTPYGLCYLDPAATLSLGSAKLDPAGHGRMSLTVPAGATDGYGLWFQSVNVDRGIVRLGLNHALLFHVGDHNDLPDSSAVAWGGGDAHFQCWGQPGERFSIVIRDPAGAVIGQCQVAIGPNGRSQLVRFPLAPGGVIAPGTTYQIWKDVGGGQVVPKWRGRF